MDFVRRRKVGERHEKQEPQMNADQRRYPHRYLTRTIIGAFFDVYNELGHGFLESVYKEAVAISLGCLGLQVEKELPLAVRFRGRVVGEFKADLVVNRTVIVELKAVRTLEAVHEAQTLNYLRAGVLEVGLLLNFGPKPQIKRLAFSNSRKTYPNASQCPGSTHAGDLQPPFYLR
jgi:GxxExxY protein